MSDGTRTLVQMDDAPANQPTREGDLGFLWDFWYPALRSTEIVGQRLATAMLLEIPLVLGRTSDGKAFAMRDSCPHRGIPLSYGRFDGKAVECSYHGWRFDACSGQCIEIPSRVDQDKLKTERKVVAANQEFAVAGGRPPMHSAQVVAVAVLAGRHVVLAHRRD